VKKIQFPLSVSDFLTGINIIFGFAFAAVLTLLVSNLNDRIDVRFLRHSSVHIITTGEEGGGVFKHLSISRESRESEEGEMDNISPIYQSLFELRNTGGITITAESHRGFTIIKFEPEYAKVFEAYIREWGMASNVSPRSSHRLSDGYFTLASNHITLPNTQIEVGGRLELEILTNMQITPSVYYSSIPGMGKPGEFRWYHDILSTRNIMIIMILIGIAMIFVYKIKQRCKSMSNSDNVQVDDIIASVNRPNKRSHSDSETTVAGGDIDVN